jgi:murein DD-endopeptidase MepM/ murein hydrolase activator NlpD
MGQFRETHGKGFDVPAFASRRIGDVNNSSATGQVRLGLALLLSLLAAAVVVPSGATAASGYVNPLRGDRYVTGRTDMGVDFCLVPGAPIRAVGDGVVVGIFPNWFRHQPYVWYQLIDGLYAGRFVYVAEQITRVLPVGSYVQAGQPVAYYKRSGTCIETGWSSVKGSTLAHITSGYREGQVTPAGVDFAWFLMSMGVHGRFQVKATTKLKPHVSGLFPRTVSTTTSGL